MWETDLEKLQKKESLRETLQFLRKEAKDKEKAASLKAELEGGALLVPLLSEEDAKVRKGAALLLGELGIQEAADALWNAYESEQTLFVKSAYLTALGKLDFSEFIPQIRERKQQLLELEPAEEERKHIEEELRELGKLLVAADGVKKHEFTGFQKAHEILLTANRDTRSITLREVREISKTVRRVEKEHPLGVLIRTEQIRPFVRLRTYRELLFPLHCGGAIPQDAACAAKMIAESDLWELLTECHKDADVFYFRLELKTRMDLAKKSAFAKKFASGLERDTNRKLQNSTGDYEIEIRLIETKEGNLIPFLKLYTIPDRRFSYRKHAVATSIHPAMAATLVKAAEPYLKEDAQILDPFCGVGTMLIERDIAVPAREKYGIDIFGDAIAGARENAAAAGELIHYIHRDYFDFKHEYPFDEIITNMPMRGRKTKEEMDAFYARFFEKSKEVLLPGGRMIFYSNEEGFVKKQLRLYKEYRLLAEFTIRKKEQFSLYVVELKG